MEKATFAAGCFWGVEETFRNVKGVLSTTVGYTGGNAANPTYEDVCTDETGHAEAVEVEFDPAQVSYAQLLDVFWNEHDPTTMNRQGPDIGMQYRSAIFFHSPEQEATARASKERAQQKLSKPIVTQIVPATPFYRAEEYHQKYLSKRDVAHSGFKTGLKLLRFAVSLTLTPCEAVSLTITPCAKMMRNFKVEANHARAEPTIA